MAVLQPSFFITVPRILSKIHGKVMEAVEKSSGMKQWMFNRAVEVKKQQFIDQGDLSHLLYDKLVFQKVKDMFGGNLQYMITASAPISIEVLTFFKISLGINVTEVYGQTEVLGPATATSDKETVGGHVGGVVPSLKVRTKDLPEMGYTSNDEQGCRGELQYQGINIFKGYY